MTGSRSGLRIDRSESCWSEALMRRSARAFLPVRRRARSPDLPDVSAQPAERGSVRRRPGATQAQGIGGIEKAGDDTGNASPGVARPVVER